MIVTRSRSASFTGGLVPGKNSPAVGTVVAKDTKDTDHVPGREVDEFSLDPELSFLHSPRAFDNLLNSPTRMDPQAPKDSYYKKSSVGPMDRLDPRSSGSVTNKIDSEETNKFRDSRNGFESGINEFQNFSS